MELTDLEKQKIMQFNKDIELVEAVRKTLLAAIYSNGTLRKGMPSNPMKNAALGLVSLASTGAVQVSNEQLGEDLRAMFHGIQLLESGFAQLAKIKEKEEGKPTYNEAI